MHSSKPQLAVVANPSEHGSGGELRALRSVKEYAKHFHVYLFTPLRAVGSTSLRSLARLKSLGVALSGCITYPRIGKLEPEFKLFFPQLTRLTTTKLPFFDGIVVLHENIDYLYAGYLLGKASGAPAMVLLQNPPLFGSKKRLSEILKAVYLWEKLTSASTLEEAYATVRLARLQVRRPIEEARIRMLLNKYSLVVGVSRATVLEMGEPWFSKAFYLDPGVNLNEEEVHLLSRIRKSVKEKENCILYKGGLTPVKGILDVLLAYRLIRKERGDLKLVITGKLDSKTHRKLLVALKKLNLKDYVVLTGFISREQLFELNAKARLLLHPSHMDSFPYTVLESLHAGTPVVGYDIPALKIYYGGLPGVRLVREGDVEALATEAIDMLERSPKEVNPPSLKSWNEIIEEELSLVKKKIARRT